ncbi:helix-turn-helix transcriptional regulator [Ichthyenterobacterium magnum]|uniref:Putative DNA-binding transcriptional regulator YafY n=1 Tax=Ichthyenterobacterium magnum TaxID=1230530 RepID=A0A420DGK9_9FLAO|nr:YafY family protein [Ichthyenterobacterium magnum]RKE92225.1 putative DNA-binding transcriptional regulator YafY [Ichthyenterobacterium magnum]
MSQLSRLISILTLLKSKRLITANELASKFNVSVRTIYRDIRKLEDAGVPVTTIEGRGYSLMDGYTIAPIQFTEKQANALITAQHLVKQTNDMSFLKDFKEALTKIKSVFRTSIQEKSELLDKNIHVFDYHYENLSSNILSEIQLAITNFSYVEINYQKVDDSKAIYRKIEPYALYSTQKKWILIAWCHLRNDYRAFRIDRIRHFKILIEKFENRKFNLQTYFQSCHYNVT